MQLAKNRQCRIDGREISSGLRVLSWSLAEASRIADTLEPTYEQESPRRRVSGTSEILLAIALMGGPIRSVAQANHRI